MGASRLRVKKWTTRANWYRKQFERIQSSPFLNSLNNMALVLGTELKNVAYKIMIFQH